jgi:hypothetical protein
MKVMEVTFYTEMCLYIYIILQCKRKNKEEYYEKWKGFAFVIIKNKVHRMAEYKFQQVTKY